MKKIVSIFFLVGTLIIPTGNADETPTPQVPAPIKIPQEEFTGTKKERGQTFPKVKDELTLDGCIALALTHAAEIKKRENQTTITGAQLLQAYGQFLPNLNAQGNYSFMKGNSYFTMATPTFVSAKNLGVGYTILSTLNLFNGLADVSGLKSAMEKDQAAFLSLKRAKEQIILDTVQSFLQVALDDEIVKIYKKTLDLSREREVLLKEQTALGIKNLADLFRQEARTSSDELNYLSAVNKERNDQLLLLRKLRIDVTKDYLIIPPKIEEGRANPKFQNEMKLVQDGLANRSDLQAINHLSDALEWDIRTHRAAYYPKLDLGFTVFSAGRFIEKQMVQGVNQVPALQQNMWSQLGSQVYFTVGLNLTWNIFDRWSSRTAVAKSRVDADNIRLDALDQKLLVESEVRQAQGDYETALQRLVSTRKGLESASKAFEVTNGRYEVGSASFVDLLSAQTSFVQAQSNRAQALIGFLLQEKTMSYALGQAITDQPTEEGREECE